jgi:hypothetical protein
MPSRNGYGNLSTHTAPIAQPLPVGPLGFTTREMHSAHRRPTEGRLADFKTISHADRNG